MREEMRTYPVREFNSDYLTISLYQKILYLREHKNEAFTKAFINELVNMFNGDCNQKKDHSQENSKGLDYGEEPVHIQNLFDESRPVKRADVSKILKEKKFDINKANLKETQQPESSNYKFTTYIKLREDSDNNYAKLSESLKRYPLSYGNSGKHYSLRGLMGRSDYQIDWLTIHSTFKMNVVLNKLLKQSIGSHIADIYTTINYIEVDD